MNKNLYIIIAILISGVAFSQVGVNTSNPQGVFNIDGGRDNPLTGAGSTYTPAQQLNDFTVLVNGNTGIGTINPSQKLHIETGGTAASPVTGFKLVDGNQNNNYVLTSDANGIGTWQINKMSILQGVLGSGVDLILNDATNNFVYGSPNVGLKQTGSYIDLPSGRWQVNITMFMPYNPYNTSNGLKTDDWFWLRSSLSETSNASVSISSDVVSNNKYSSANFQGPATAATGSAPFYVTRFGLMSGVIIVNNTSGTTKRYYYVAGAWNLSRNDMPGRLYQFGGSSWAENSITAIPLN